MMTIISFCLKVLIVPITVLRHNVQSINLQVMYAKP